MRDLFCEDLECALPAPLCAGALASLLSIAHANQKQSVGGSSKAGCTNLAGVQPRGDIFDANFAKRAFHKRTDNQSHHLVQETVAIELDCHARTFLPDAHRINRADRALFGFPAIGGEAGEIMSADELLRCSFQEFEIERACDVPCTSVLKRR